MKKKEPKEKQPKERQPVKRTTMTKKTKFQILSVCSLLVSALSMGGVYLYAQAGNVQVTVPVVAKDIVEGSKILPEDITTIQVHPSAITPNMMTSAENIIGTYSLKDMSVGEYLYSNWLSTDYYKRIADKAQYTAIPVPVSQFTSVNGEIKENDFVMFSIIMGAEEGEYASDVTSNQLPEKKVTILEPPQLSAVRVLGVVDGSGLSVDELRKSIIQPNGKVPLDGELPQPTMLIVDVNDIQRTFLLQAMNAGKIQAVILPEAEQQIQREKFGLIQNDVMDNSQEQPQQEQSSQDGYNPYEDTSTEELQQITDEALKQQIQSEADRLGITYEEAFKLYQEQQGGAS